MGNKKCSKCKEVQSVSNFTLYKTGALAGKYRSWCRKCSSAQVANWSRRNQNYLREKQRKYYVDKPHLSIRHKMKRYGKDEVWYLAKFEQQRGVCAICREPETTKKANGNVYWLSVDHHHGLGHIRGLLCMKCNQKLGIVEQHDWILKAVEYLKQYEPL